MVYTCYEMIQDCRADRPEGWRSLVSNYVPVIRKLLAHYHPAGSAAILEQVLLALRDPQLTLFQSLQPAPERWFVAELRQKVLAELPDPQPEIEIGLDAVSEAFEPLTLLEKQAAWIETMGYDAAATGVMLRMSQQTAARIRDRAAELLRGKTDSWRRTLLSENGRTLGRAAAAASTKDCLPVKEFLDVLDGRSTWRDRETLEQHVRLCWHCIDHFARMAEVIELIRGVEPLPDAEAAPFHKLLRVEPRRKSFWKR